MRKRIITLLVLFNIVLLAQKYTDKPFLQDYADKYIVKKNYHLQQVQSDRNNVIKVLSTEGLLQPWDKNLVKDLHYRPLSDMNIISLEVYDNHFVYLTDKAVLSNAWAGKFYFEHEMDNPKQFVVAHDFTTLVAGKNKLKLFQDSKETWKKSIKDFNPLKLIFDKSGKRFLILTNNSLYQLKCPNKKIKIIYKGKNLTSFTLKDSKIIVGTNDGVITLDGKSFNVENVNRKLPWTEITTTENINGSLWFGSTKGAFKLRNDGKYDYYSSKRWLVDDEVIDITKGPENSVLVLTKHGLSKINFVEMTLADKADYFEKIQRQRHIRYGFSSYLGLKIPGDLSSGYYKDSDNDGLWTSMYLAGELFRYAVTKSEDAKQNAYEAFEAMERLTEITGLDGFPARTYERDGYQVDGSSNGLSEEEILKRFGPDGRIWRLDKTGKWRWKSTTSSDESCGHFFVYALFAELAPDKEWRDRAIHQIKIEMDHIIEHDWYLVTWNGKPTQWGRWNPEYVNNFPINVGDRRLNSTLILAFLQTAYHFTKDEKYKEKAYELINKFGYDENANRPASVVGFVEGEDLSDRWNHSDDEMYFLTIPAFVNYSFTSEQKQKHFEAARSHWLEERSEKNPLWNFLYALTGGKDYDLNESVWWLKNFPLDLISWKVENRHRKDLIKIEPNFRGQEYSEVLPRDERPMHLHNGAYRNNGGDNGRREYPPYLYLFPYWAGRYVDAISAPVVSK